MVRQGSERARRPRLGGECARLAEQVALRGGWHYVNQTAGFEVPAHERICPVCSDPLLPGDDLIGRGDREGPDGALHGLWIHLRCAGKATIPEIADDYWAAGHHPELDGDPKAKEEHGALMERLLAKVRG